MDRQVKILVIDDEKSILSTLEEFLKLKNFDVVRVEDGQDAIQLLHSENGRFDIVITDLKMKTVSGIAVTQWTKNHYPDIPVIMITGYLSQYEVLALETKADLLLEKPFDFSKLESDIRTLLAKKRPPGANE